MKTLLTDALERIEEALRSSLERFQRDPGGEALHDLRVALRRTAALASLFRGMPSEGEGIELKKAAQELRRELSPARQLEVSRELLRSMGETAASLLPEPPPVSAEAMAETKRRVDDLAAALEGWSRRARGARSTVDAKQTARLMKRVNKARARVLEIGPPTRKTVHPLRIAGKALRYRLELVAPADASAAELVRASKKFQDALGDAHDWECLAEDLDERAGDAPLAVTSEIRVRRAATLARARRDARKFCRALEETQLSGTLAPATSERPSTSGRAQRKRRVARSGRGISSRSRSGATKPKRSR